MPSVTQYRPSSLVERGWGTTLIDGLDNLQGLSSMFEIHPEKMRKAAPLPNTSMGPQIDYSKGYIVEEIRDAVDGVTHAILPLEFSIQTLLIQI